MKQVWDGPIAIVGAGQLGSGMMEALLNQGFPADQLRVVTRSQLHAEALAAEYGVHAWPLAQAVDGATAVFVAARIPQMPEVLTAVAAALAPGAVVISLAGGPRMDELAASLPTGTPLLRAMTTPAVAHHSLTGLCPASDCPDEVVEQVRELLGRFGPVLMVEEQRLGLIGDLSGHGQAVIYYAADAMVQWGVMHGFSRAEATRMVAQTVAGASRNLSRLDESPVELQNRLCTPGGTTVRAMAELDERATRAAIMACIDGGRFK